MGPEVAARQTHCAATAAARSRGERAGRWGVWHARLSQHTGWCLVAAALATAALCFSHLPSLLLHAQFYADDGSWYQTAYAHGPLVSLWDPAAGYLIALQRITASLSLLLPTVAVPTFFNAVGLLVEAGGICYLLSRRMADSIPRLAVRVAIALLVIALPNSYDTTGNLTNAQWHLGLIAFLVVFAGRPRRLWGWICDGAVLILSGLTGPYCILLEPIAAWRWLRDRGDRRRGFVLLANSACAIAQVAVLAAAYAQQRSSQGLAPGMAALVTLLGRQLTLGLTSGAHGLSGLVGTPLGDNLVALAVLAAIPVVACAWAGWRGPAILGAFCAFAALELVLALVAPSIPSPRWPNLGEPADIVNFHPGGIRYFLYPLLAFAISLGWLAARRARPSPRPEGKPPRRLRDAPARVGAVAAFILLLLSAANGVPRDWLYPPYLDQHWGAQVQRLDAAAPGTRGVIPINPRGWTITLTAR